MTSLSVSDILFPSQEDSLTSTNKSLNRILGDLKRSSLTITNRLRSIQQDADFVEGVRSAFSDDRLDQGGEQQQRRPLVANERCGSWYIRPEVKGGSAYFKSTDGHTGQWKFSTRRLNLHLLPLIERFDGIIIVDSTRRGKRMPDALSKTVPIWCCVLNRVLFPDKESAYNLYVPPNAVSASEKSQMLARIPEGVEAFKQLKLDIGSLRAQISKPLRPTWVTQETDLSHLSQDDQDEEDGGDEEDQKACGRKIIFDDFRPVICCTSSKRVTDGEMSGHTGGYIQGAGDDTENWAFGLTPPVFWAHADELLSTDEVNLPETIKRLVACATSSASHPGHDIVDGGVDAHSLPSTTVRQLTPFLYVSPLPLPLPSSTSSKWCQISLLPTTSPPETWIHSPTQLNVGLGKHKVASRNLRVALANICEFVTRYLLKDSDLLDQALETADSSSQTQQQEGQGQQKRIIIACETGGRDLSIGVALALHCWCFEDDEGRVPRTGASGAPDNESNHPNDKKMESTSLPAAVSFNKTMIKIRLGRIMTAMPDANPNRATLQSVNSFLMDWRK